MVSQDVESMAKSFVKSWHDHCLRVGLIDGRIEGRAIDELVTRVAAILLEARNDDHESVRKPMKRKATSHG